MPKNKRGRPPVPKSAFKGCYVVCRMTKPEAEAIAAAARWAKQDKSEWMRKILLNAANR